ncbi:hypothetical protein A2960_00435 [Candidatus Gottesmanbacteria bacterium RIFCSPLOWO2_01_FULL_39_12b]|uniref:Gcp-like domain-containing protein n=1 Tax=Candidatus Gottesmanbacteria bacterium RIFCSPLOWO2_01_FULL_39_12b TaxID=1798388 RepID=A0A1F6APL7_9BACT|nr:MAG: hypothetical protein A2960_00435 [Candidatus Gottesmanbacteria bacterium RIFCSPLOWO2_01_FULL_39_12b]
MKQKVVLHIDTSQRTKTKISLDIAGHILEKISISDSYQSQRTLPLISAIFRENKLKPEDITEIKIFTGPGSFTGLRVGATIGNTLGWLLNVPVNGKKGNIVDPQY